MAKNRDDEREFSGGRANMVVLFGMAAAIGVASIPNNYSYTGTISDVTLEDYAPATIRILGNTGPMRVFNVSTARDRNYPQPMTGKPVTVEYTESYWQHFVLPMIPASVIPDKLITASGVPDQLTLKCLLTPCATELRVYKKPEPLPL